MKLNFFKSFMLVFLLGCVHLACAQSTYKWDANTWMAENGDYSQTELDEFCSIFFESIEAGLLADKYVKIKGFGTFKLINVSDRESINVNTGERIQISGHAKASFIPDNDLKDLINSPFAHFQTVAINDETNLEEMSSIADDDILEMEQALETDCPLTTLISLAVIPVTASLLMSYYGVGL